MKFLLATVVLLLLALPGGAAAQSMDDMDGMDMGGPATIIDSSQGPFHVTATLLNQPLIVGPADLRITVTDSASGQPLPPAAVNVVIKSMELGRDQLYIATPEAGAAAVYRSHRLYFATSGAWEVRVQVLDAVQQYEFVGMVEVAPVSARIIDAALKIVPVFVALLVVGYIGLRQWRRRQRPAV